jgi:hypothetical protein
MTPVVLPTGDAPTGTAPPAAANGFIQDQAGEWFVRPPLAQAEPGLNGVIVLTVDGAGFAVVTEDQATHDRERAQQLLPVGDDVAIRSLRQLAAQRLPSGRRDGVSTWTGKPWRKGHDTVAIARALVARGLMSLGQSHRAAIREWMRWEHDLGGEYGNDDAFESLRRGHQAMWRPYEDGIAATNRRVWKELGPNLYPKAASERPDDTGHEHEPPDRSRRRR